MAARTRAPNFSVFINESGQEWEGAQEARAAFEKKDTQALSAVLARYPQVWNAQLCSFNRKGSIGKRGPLAHFAIEHNWPAALQVLFDSGDRFELKNDSGQSVLYVAARLANLTALRKLINLGVPINPANEENTVFSSMARNISDVRPQKLAAAASLLLKAGADGWATVEYRDGPMSLPEYCLESGSNLAHVFTRSGPVPESIRQDPSSFHRRWLANIKSNPHHSQDLVFDALVEHGLMPSPALFISGLEGARTQPGGYGGLSEQQCLFGLIVRRLAHPLDEDCELPQLLALMAPHPVLNSLYSQIEQRSLAQATPTSALSRSGKKVRL